METTLRQDTDEEYTLLDPHERVWITVGNHSICIHKADEGVIVDMYAHGREDGDSIASAYVLDSEVEPEEDEDEEPIHFCCVECGKAITDEESVWIDPRSTLATMHGKRYCVGCAPASKPCVCVKCGGLIEDYDDLMYTTTGSLHVNCVRELVTRYKKET